MSMHQHLRLGALRGLNRCDLLNLGRINVLCGKNNTGKSTLLEAAASEKTACFGFTPDNAFVEGLIEANKRGLYDHLARASSRLNVPYDALLNDLTPIIQRTAQSRSAWFAEEESEFTNLLNTLVRETGNQNILSVVYTTGILEHLKRPYQHIRWNAVYIPPTRTIEVAGTIATGAMPNPQGQNIINRLFHLRNQPPGSQEMDRYNQIESAFEDITDGFTFGVFTHGANNYALKFSRDKNTWIPAEHCGKGLQDLLVILFFALGSRNRLLLIEEPEVHLHPEMQRKLLAYLRSNTQGQYIFSTHSNIFLDSTLTDRVFLTRFDSEVLVLDATRKATFLHDLGYSSVDNLVSDLIILVEGPTDVPIMEELLKKRGLYDEYNIKLWPLGGDIMAKDEIDLTIFADSHQVIALVDGDPKSGKARKRFQEKCAAIGIECTRLKRYAIENYFSVEALRAVYGTRIPASLTEIFPSEKLEDQVGFNVKGSNRAIARSMRLDDLAGSDLGSFLNRVDELLTRQ